MMGDRARTIIAPELIWLALFALTLALASSNNPPTVAGNQPLEAIGWFLPVVGVAVAFVPPGLMRVCSQRCVAT